MNLIFSALSSALGAMFSVGWIIFINGGWLIFAAFIAFIVLAMYRGEIGSQFQSKMDKILLQIKVERNNLQSTLAVEQIFAQLHAIHAGISFAEQHLEGKSQATISLEIASIGGKIGYFVYTPRRYVGLIESAFYSRYPSAEITEVQDYMKAIGPWSPDSPWDVWGTEMKMIKDHAFPLKTYSDFEHSAAEEKIIDPSAGLIEALNHAEPHELLAVQFCLTPVGDPEWAPKALEFAKKMKKDILAGGADAAADPDAKKSAGGMSPGERRVLEAIEEKAAKPAYRVKIRLIHIAPKDKFNGGQKAALIGGFRVFGDGNTNGLKPDTSKTWTSHNYVFFKSLEQPYLDYKTESKKKKFVSAFAARSGYVGIKPMILNVEELATMYHFPINPNAMQSNVENISVRKGQPPADLPMFS